MNPVTLRRLLVFGVCAAGVAALYVVPSLSATPGPVAVPQPHDERTGRPVRATPVSVPSSSTTASAASSSSSADDRPAARPSEPRSTAPAERERSSSRPSATAYDPRTASDHSAPAPVEKISTSRVLPDRITLSWPAASDNVAVVGYRVWLNGFAVVTTPETHATVRWFNDDLSEHVVQVRALDAAGNESRSSPNLLVARPSTEPTPSPTTPGPEPSATGSPSSPEPSSSPAGGGALEPSASAAGAEPSASAGGQ